MYKRFGEETKEFLGTDINVSYLEHELGHAWHAEKDEYIMQEDETLKQRVGVAEQVYSFKKEDGKIMKKREHVEGIMMEEAMNTIAEEKAMAKYMGLPLDKMKEIYRTCGSPLMMTNYQGYISETIEYMAEKWCEGDIEDWRLFGDVKSKTKVENIMSKTKFWQEREQDILPDSDNPRNYTKKRAIMSKMKSEKIQRFFRENEEIYFPDISQMTPLGKIDNVLEQLYNIEIQKIYIDVEEYDELLDYLGWEVYPLINQAVDLKREEELRNTIGNVRLSELNAVVRETREVEREKQIVLEGQRQEKGENR